MALQVRRGKSQRPGRGECGSRPGKKPVSWRKRDGKGYEMEKRIVVYNNRTGIVEKVAPLCRVEGFSVAAAADVETLYEMLEAWEIHLMLVDVELGDKGWDKGIEMIARLRHKSRIPLIVVSAQSAETAKIMALEAGADDYVTAGCNPLELLARIKSQVRRYTQMAGMNGVCGRVYRAGGLVVDDGERKVMVEGREVRLTPVEYKILCLLVRQRGKVFSNSQIYENIWKMRAVGTDNTVAVHICHIREKIEQNPRQPKYLMGVWGNGYKVVG